MTEPHILALIAAYCLSRDDRQGVHALGYSNFNEAYRHIGECLGVKPNTIKNMRDEFDAVHSNDRAGWHQRPLRPSRAVVISMFEGIAPATLAGIVRDFLNVKGYAKTPEIRQILQSIENRGEDDRQRRVYVPRASTGRRAEDKFLEWFHAGILPFSGAIRDRRDDGCGYDFHITGNQEWLIEVKGLSDDTGGIAFTDKEWSEAFRHSGYRVFLVYGLESGQPQWKVIEINNDLIPRRSVQIKIEVRWHLTTGQIGL